jgi:hypothetical protein
LGFWASLMFCRPTPPPRVRAAELGAFVAGFDALGVIGNASARMATVRFGEGLDRDPELVPGPDGLLDEEALVLESVKSRPVDLSFGPRAIPAERLGSTLREDTRAILRAHVSLGSVRPALWEAMRFETPLNDRSFAPDGWSLEMGVIEAGLLGGEGSHHVGWIAVCLSGPGYAYPRTPAEIAATARRQADVLRVEELCRTTWPVEATRASESAIERRRAMEKAWVGGSLDLPMDWFWTLNET